MLHTLYDSWQRCRKNVLTRLHITLGISLHCFTFYINNPSDGKEKEDINLQLQYHHLYLSVNSTEATILHIGVRGSIKKRDRYKENRNLVNSLEQLRSNLGGKTTDLEKADCSPSPPHQDSQHVLDRIQAFKEACLKLPISFTTAP